ncbi:hypothetical protein IID20_04975, partial [Patescibacteria group bacterium]|nr:hypothetical protein [Patescibacteria group bacterium]
LKNEYDQGIDLLKEAVALDPGVRISINNLKKILKTLGEKELELELVSDTREWLKQLEEN